MAVATAILMLCFASLALQAQENPAQKDRPKAAAPDAKKSAPSDTAQSRPGFQAVPTREATSSTKKPQTRPAIPSLEDMLAEALTNSPEVRVAAAAVRQVEAELERVRYDVAQKVIALHGSLQQQRANIDKARAISQDEEMLHSRGTSTLEQVTKRRVELTQAESKYDETWAQIPFLLGRQMRGEIVTRVYPIPVQDKELLPRIADLVASILSDRGHRLIVEGFVPNSSLVVSGTASQHEKVQETLTRLRDLGALDRGVPSKFHLKDQAMMQRLAKGVHRRVSCTFAETPLEEVLAFLSAYTGTSFSLDSSDFGKAPIDLSLDGVPMGAVIQALEDRYFLRFYVREYGVFVARGTVAPDTGIRLVDFWKNVPPPAEGATELGGKASPASPEPKSKKAAP